MKRDEIGAMKGEIGSIFGPRVRTTRQRIDFYHGWDWDNGEFEDLREMLIQRFEWVMDKYGEPGLEDKPLMPGYVKYDLDDNGRDYDQWAAVLQPRDLARVSVFLNQYESEHAENHFIHLHPLCPTCRGHMVIARLSVCSWLTRNPGKVPPNPSDSKVPWDTERIPFRETGKEQDLYMTPDQLSEMKMPVDLIDGILPRKGVGYITGRDRSLKTFLALDICLHHAAMAPAWHRATRKGEQIDTPHRKMRGSDRSSFIFAAGEGVDSFAPRLAAWEKAQHVMSGGQDLDRTPDGEQSIRHDDCARCAKETNPLIGHVYNIEDKNYDTAVRGAGFMLPGFGIDEKSNITVKRGSVDLFRGGDDYTHLLALARRDRPDIIVLDTLALSSGAADQQAATDMGIVHSNAKRLSDVSGGLVILIAHTDKGDSDARGSSVIEDNADFVLHCSRPQENQLEVKIAKRKDAEDGWSFLMGVEQIELEAGKSSLILTDWDRELYGDPEPEVDPEQDRLDNVMDALELAIIGHHKNSVTLYEVQDETEPPEKRRAMAKLLDRAEAQGLAFASRRHGASSQWHLPKTRIEALRTLGMTIAEFDDDGV